ncbi:MAG: DUF4743 domain-containing protein [Hyphomicrobiales bacterium]|nr:DUF4743 domain-containing protein [Hyphomicrobiales bacterium]MCP5371148.1 DUF4743 domain-containing protein [Hyphomicrobiales bacterium]
MSYLDRLDDCNSRDLSAYRPLVVDGQGVGLLNAEMAAALADHGDVFAVTDRAVTLVDGLRGYDARTAAVDAVVHRLVERGLVPRWRGEAYRVGTGFHAPALFELDRGAVANFGVLGFGVHVNGFVRGPGDEIHMWIGRRAANKPSAPNKLDHIVAGGQPAGLGLFENLVKECAEEADIPADLAGRARPVSATSYIVERPEGLRRDVLFNYDLELPADFTPKNTDGEVAAFYLWPLAQVMETVRETREFKFNCAVIVIDFLIRHGRIPPEHPEYLDLQRRMRRDIAVRV